MSGKTIALIHGLSASEHNWEFWVARNRARGDEAIGIPHSVRDASLAALKQRPNDLVPSTITLPELIDAR